MKKHLLLFVFVLVASVMSAQNGEMYSLMFHDMSEYQHNVENFMRQHDGDFIFATFVATEWIGPTNPGTPLGNIIYKMSPSTLTITDSLFIDDPDAPWYFYARDPHGTSNIRANFEYDEESDSTFLRICRFPDNDLNIDHDEDVVVPVCEGLAIGEADSPLVDSRDDMIWKYYKSLPAGEHECHVIRFDADGYLKLDTVLPSSQNFTYKMREFSESPLQYYHWKGAANDNLSVFVIDSVFHTKYYSILNKILSQEIIDSVNNNTVYESLSFNIDTKVIPVGGDNVLVAARYSNDTTLHTMGERGVAVAKFDMRTMQLKNYIVFNDYPGHTQVGSCMGLKKMSDGTVYFVYKENGYPAESVIVVKMDVNLNVEWKRFCKTDNVAMSSPFRLPPVIVEDAQGNETGVAWTGGGKIIGTEKQGFTYFFLNHDGTVGVNESGMEIRPYCFYPNPVQAQLQMQFSPDVQPKQVELYDLQGRLVHVQRSSFDSIDMGQLPAGTYTIRVTLEDGTVFSDKVVRE